MQFSLKKMVLFGSTLAFLLSACKTATTVKDGATAYSLKQYSIAADLLIKEYNTEKDPIKKREKAFTIAESFRKYNDTKNALEWYQKSVDLGNEMASFELGKMQMMNENYEDAIKSFTEFGKLSSASKLQAQREIKNSQNALEWKSNFNKYNITNLSQLNSTASDFSPILYKGKLVFSSSRNEATGDAKNAWTGDKSADLFESENLAKPHSFSNTLNSKDYEGTCAFNKDGDEIYFTRCKVVEETISKKKAQEVNNEFCHIYLSKLSGGIWQEAEQVKLFADTINVGQPALSKDGKILYVSADAKDGFGGKDLYYFTKTDTGWYGPSNAGNYVNTSGDEMFPWLDEKSNLYFASNGLPGMGGLDIFKAIKGKNIWKEAKNLQSPINSGADDFGLIVEKYKPKNLDDTILFAGYFTSARSGGKGNDDIYRFEEKWVNFFTLKGTVVEKEREDTTNPDSKILGLKPLAGAKVELRNPTTDNVLASAVSNAAGLFTFKLDAETDYKLVGNKINYFSKTETATTKGKRNQDSVNIFIYSQIELERIFTQKEIVIPNIYYDYDKATLRPESQLVLDSILIFFNENKDLTIEIGSHTDSRGSDSYNLKLSQARAQSVVDYLVLKGVAKDRLVAVGFGETKLVNNCANGVNCTEEEHQKNRRTTFRITGTKQKIESVEPENIKVDPKPEEK
jgi:outer membrane protein OmpA-like peptidoglycan-associated protein/tetratricopeptide (TPR) repeat protein